MNGTIQWPSGARQIVEESAQEAAPAGFSLAATIVFGIGLVITVLIVVSIYKRRRK
ncbi:hypothetical protein [Cohnella sp. JJ-181]|uniref:hypothetical protein n=1 Tax=Cohnella rhizoplanae TaxID=2974897 RepID=UPI0023310B40|nr:hypothetical protein [Cohnella sp. JJ-181]